MGAPAVATYLGRAAGMPDHDRALEARGRQCNARHLCHLSDAERWSARGAAPKPGRSTAATGRLRARYCAVGSR